MQHKEAPTSTLAFYTCSSCTAADPSGAIAVLLAALGAVAPRRRRQRAVIKEQ